jgi:hypothetical protein
VDGPKWTVHDDTHQSMLRIWSASILVNFSERTYLHKTRFLGCNAAFRHEKNPRAVQVLVGKAES